MAKPVDQLIDELIGREGRYVNDPHDAGGETNFGITAAVARAHGYLGPMRDLPRATAAAIYKAEYFARPGFDQVYAVSQPIAEELFDTGVNMGTGVPGPWLQRILNALNREQADYADLRVDGAIGPATIGALRAYLNRRGADGETVILRLLNCLQGARYLDLTERRAANEAFLHGWILNRVEAA